MSSTNPNQTTTTWTECTQIRVLYNDAAANRQTETEEAMPGERMSEATRDRRRSGAIMPAFSRMLSDSYYHPGDPLLEVLTEDVDTPADPNQSWAMAQCERLYAMLNIDHPRDWAHRSMCVGDVIVIGETAWVCDDIGFAPVDGITADQIKEA